MFLPIALMYLTQNMFERHFFRSLWNTCVFIVYESVSKYKTLVGLLLLLVVYAPAVSARNFCVNDALTKRKMLM